MEKELLKSATSLSDLKSVQLMLESNGRYSDKLLAEVSKDIEASGLLHALKDTFDFSTEKADSLDKQLYLPESDAKDIEASVDGADVRNGGGTGTTALGITVIDYSPGFNNVTPGFDFIFGTNDDDTLLGFGDNDIIFSGNGNDFVLGGVGNDIILAGNGDNMLFGETGNDFIITGNGNNYIDGGYGDDFIYTGSGNDTVYDTGGNDTIYTGAGDDEIYAGYYTNTNGRDGDVFVDSGDGNDLIWTISSLNTLINREILAGNGEDQIYISNSDRFFDSAMNVDAGNGNDTIYIVGEGLGNNDFVYGGAGDDVFQLTNRYTYADLSIYSQALNQQYYIPATYSIQLFGGDGNDTFTATNCEFAALTGGAGNDIFEFSNDNYTNVVTDFTLGQDKIILSISDLTTNSSLWNNPVNFSGTDAQIVNALNNVYNNPSFTDFVTDLGTGGVLIDIDMAPLAFGSGQVVLQGVSYNAFMGAVNSGVDIFDFV